MAPDLGSIDHVHVFVSDRVGAEAWYQRVLGFERMPDLEFWAAGGGPLNGAIRMRRPLGLFFEV